MERNPTMDSRHSAIGTIRLGVFAQLGLVRKREGGGYGLRSPKTQTSGELRSNLFIAPKNGALIASLYEMIKPMVIFRVGARIRRKKRRNLSPNPLAP